MSTTGPVEEMIEERKKQKQNALNKLVQFAQEEKREDVLCNYSTGLRL